MHRHLPNWRLLSPPELRVWNVIKEICCEKGKEEYGDWSWPSKKGRGTAVGGDEGTRRIRQEKLKGEGRKETGR